MDARILSKLGKRGRKFLLVGILLVLGAYLLCYLVIYWFLASDRGQAWIERTLSSRLGIVARWEGAAVSPFLEPSLRNVTIELPSPDGPPRRIQVRDMVFRWSIRGDQGVRLRGIDSISGLAEGLSVEISDVDVAWERRAETRRLSLVVNGPQIGIVVGEGELRIPSNLDDLRSVLGTLYEFAETTLGTLEVNEGRISIVDQNGVIELRDVSIMRDRTVSPLRVWGRATAQGGTAFQIEGVLSGGSPSDATAEVLVTSSDLRWVPEALLPTWIPEELKGPVSLLASVSTAEPLRLFGHFGESTISDARLLSRQETPENIPRVPRSFVLEVASVSPLSATIAANLENIPLSEPLPGLSARAASASGTIVFTRSATGVVDLAVAFDRLDCSTGDLRVTVPAAWVKVQAKINPQTGLQDGVFDLHVEPTHLAVGGRQIGIPSLILSVKGFETRSGGEVVVEQIRANLDGVGEITGDLVASTSPSLSITGRVDSQGLPLVRLWQIVGGAETEWKPTDGIADLTCRFQSNPETKEIFIHFTVANADISGATITAKQLEVESNVVLDDDGSWIGSVSVSASDLLCQSLELPQASLSARVSRTGWGAPIRISDISVSCDLFSATGEVEIIVDDRGPESLTYDITVRFDDLSETYKSAEEMLNGFQLDGLDVGGRATVRLSGGWVRSRDWRTSAHAELHENYVLADARDIPVQWESLGGHFDLNARSEGKGIIQTEARVVLSDFAALIGNYDLDASGQSFSFALDGIYDQKTGFCSFRSFSFQGPGDFSGEGHGSWSSNDYSLTAKFTIPDLASSYESFLKDLAADRWSGAATLIVGGSAQVEIAADNRSQGFWAEGALSLSHGSAQLDDQTALRGISAFLSAGINIPVTGAPLLEPRKPMQLTASHIQWGSNVVENITVQPRIEDGDLLWEETISLPLYGGNVRIGPVRIAKVISSDWCTRSSVYLERVGTPVGPGRKEILPTASEVDADLSEISISKDVLAATGEMSLHIFDGLATVSRIRVWQFFSSYPIWGGDLTFDAMDLARVCAWLGLGHMEGRVSGSVKNLQLSIGEEIKPISFELDVESDPGGGVISREALKMIIDLSQQTSTRVMLDRAEYAYDRLGLGAKLLKDRFFLWGKFKDGNTYYFLEPPSLVSRLFSRKFHTVRIALNSPDQELSFEHIWTRIQAVSKSSLQQPQIEFSLFQRLNPF